MKAIKWKDKECRVPYSKSATDELIGTPKKYYSEQAAIDLAIWSYRRAIQLGDSPKEAVGISCSARFYDGKDRPNGYYLVKQTYSGITFQHRNLTIQNRRLQEDQCVTDLHILYNSQDEYVYEGIGDVYADLPFTYDADVIYSGSFNPLHQGHRDIYDYCTRYGRVLLEISLSNCRKDKITARELSQRYVDLPYVVTDKPYFSQKLKHCKNNTKFAVGADTYNSICWDWEIITKLKYKNCSFLVFPRDEPVKLRDGDTLADCQPTKISSSQIRNQYV